MEKAFVIIRVSSQDQLKGYGPDVQWEDDVVPNAPLLGLEVSEQYKRVIQESATTWERTKFEGSIREALFLHSKNEIKALLFPRVDRETRFIYSSFPLLCEVIKAGLKIFFARERFELDPKNPESTERYLNKAIQAESYIKTMIANTTNAKRKLVEKGILPTGTGKGLYGYKWEKATKKRIPVEYEIRVIEKIFNMLAEGISRFKVAKILNEQGILTKSQGKWHPLTIQRIATNEAYTGVTYYYKTKGSRRTSLVTQSKEKWKVLPDVTPTVISRELFDRVQNRLKQQKEARHNLETRHYLLRGYAYCCICGSPLVGTCLNRKFLYYHCRGASPTSAREAICNAKYIRAEKLENLVWEKVKTVISDPDIVLAELRKQAEAVSAQTNITSLDKEISIVERQLKGYPDQEKRLINILKIGQFTQDYILDELNRTKAAREADLAKLQELRRAKSNLSNLEKAEVKLNEFYAGVKKNLEQCSDDDKRLAFEMLALRVKATHQNVEITAIIPVDITTAQSSDSLLTTERTSA